MTSRFRRVLVLVTGAFGPGGGLELYDRMLIRALGESVEEVRVVSLTDRAPNVDVRYLPPAVTAVRVAARKRLRFVRTAMPEARRFQPDLIIVGHVNLSPLAMMLRMAMPKTEQWLLTYGIDVWKRLTPMQRRVAERAERILSISDYTRREMARFNDLPVARIELLPCALDPFWAEDFEHLGRENAAPAGRGILTVGRLSAAERYKGIDRIIEAMPNVLASVPDARYVVIGDGDDRARLEQLAVAKGVRQAVDFRGRVSAEELAHAYRSCDVFAMPSAGEGFGIVYLEAALFRKPSIAGAHGGAPEVVTDGETGHLVKHDDVPELARLLILHLTKREESQRLGEAAQRRLQEQFTYSSFLQRVRQFLQ